MIVTHNASHTIVSCRQNINLCHLAIAQITLTVYYQDTRHNVPNYESLILVFANTRIVFNCLSFKLHFTGRICDVMKRRSLILTTNSNSDRLREVSQLEVMRFIKRTGQGGVPRAFGSVLSQYNCNLSHTKRSVAEICCISFVLTGTNVVKRVKRLPARMRS